MKKPDITPFILLDRKLRGLLDAGLPEHLIAAVSEENPWFTKKDIEKAIGAICSQMLEKEKLENWLDNYDFPEKPGRANIAVIMAGNIPLVGFFDMLCVLVSGMGCLVKPSSKDSLLIKYIIGMLQEIASDLPLKFLLPESDPDGIIAMGGDEAVKAIRTKYGNIPMLLRGNRTSIAVLTGNETPEQLAGLAEDIFSYYGLGCRNVSRLLIPTGYDLQRLAGILSQYELNHPRYINGYRQNKALMTMAGTGFIDGGFFTLSETYGKPDCSGNLSDIKYSYYASLKEAEMWLTENDEAIQCIVASNIMHPRHADFGKSQYPTLTDYPDGKDVIRFLLSECTG